MNSGSVNFNVAPMMQSFSNPLCLPQIPEPSEPHHQALTQNPLLLVLLLGVCAPKDEPSRIQPIPDVLQTLVCNTADAQLELGGAETVLVPILRRRFRQWMKGVIRALAEQLGPSALEHLIYSHKKEDFDFLPGYRVCT